VTHGSSVFGGLTVSNAIEFRVVATLLLRCMSPLLAPTRCSRQCNKTSAIEEEQTVSGRSQNRRTWPTGDIEDISARGITPNGRYGILRDRRIHSALMPASFTTLPHLSVPSTMNFLNSAGVVDIGYRDGTGVHC
jgi:hypothetical protein